MVIGKHRPTYININLQAIKNNLKMARHKMRDNQLLFAVVKANAYGHGLIPVSVAADEAGADGFCVAIIDEGIALRDAGILKPILILGVISYQYAKDAALYNLTVTVGDIDFLINAQKLLANEHLKLKVHIALDTGMGRIGFHDINRLKKALDFIKLHSEQFYLEGVFTHFATADSKNYNYFNKQVARLHSFLNIFDSLPKYVHVSNSATTIWHNEIQSSIVRFGIGMYGLNPSGNNINLPNDMNFYPAFSLFSTIVSIRQNQSGDSVSYGATYTSSKEEWIGTVPIGYADGWLRRLQGFNVLVNGIRCKIVGRICMDQMMIRLPYKVPVGTKVVLIGSSGNIQNTVESVADYSNTINYEIVSTISQRVPRFYIN